MQSIRQAYEREKRTRGDGSQDITSLPCKKRGRHLLIGETVDKQVQEYLRKVRLGGGVVTSRIAVAAAKGILLACDRLKLLEFGGHVSLGPSWGYSLLERMKFVRRKATTAKSKLSLESFSELKRQFLNDVVSVVQLEEIPPELILNWDQTGVKIVPSSLWTMDQQGSKRVEVVGISDKRLITAVFCGSAIGEFLPVQLIYKGKTPRCHPKFSFPLDWHITHSPRHWSNESTMIDYIKEIIVPFVKGKREFLSIDKPALVIMDNFTGQITQSITEILEKYNIHVCLLPPNTTDRLQPMDLSVNKPAKDFLKRKFEDWYSTQIQKQLQGHVDIEALQIQPVDMSMPVMKELGARWLVEMYEYIVENPLMIVNGFIKSGILAALDRVDDLNSSEFDEFEDDEYTDEDLDEQDDEQQDDE